jgi:ubiquinone biosynthesis UbiH/UbiF/VisC/COQ6 family hydroxylase
MAVDICIRGAGVVGKALALLLARERMRVALVVDADPHAQDIRSFALNAASKALLEGLRAWPTAACAVQHMQVQGDDGGCVHFDAAPSTVSQPTDALAWIVDAAALEEQLSLALSFQSTVQLVSQPQEAALTVVCEGKASATRAALGVEYESFSYGQQAIAARMQCEQAHQATARQWMGANGEVLALLPRHTPGDSKDSGNSVALVWSVSQDHAQHLLALDDAAFCAVLQNACSNALGHMQLTTPRASWPLHVTRALHWVGEQTEGKDRIGAWALAGDAAHTVHPLAGQGLNLGLADVAALASILKDKEYFRSYGDARLLRRYERARKADAALLRTATDGLQRLFAFDDSRVQALRNWGMMGFEKLAPLKAAVMRRAMGV